MAEIQSMQTAISKPLKGGLLFLCGSPVPGQRNHSGQWWQLLVHRRWFQEALPEMNTTHYTVQNWGSPTSRNNLNQLFSLFCIESLTSSVAMVLSMIALIGSLLLTKIWKAVAVTILRSTGKKWKHTTCITQMGHCLFFQLDYNKPWPTSHLWWI